MYLNKYTKPSRCTLPGFDENFANLCTAKHKSTLVDKKKNELPHKSFVVNAVLYR